MPETINILIIGDVIGRAGRYALSENLHKLVDEHQVDFVVANGENMAAGFGLTAKIANEMFGLGIHVLTNGNHCWDKRELLTHIDSDERLIRPFNFSTHAPGRGWTIQETASGHPVAVINLIGQVFMGAWNCPFEAVEQALDEIPDDVKIILVDIHAEATSEKIGMGWFLDGRVSCVYGTHTHVPTCDETIRSQGTAYQSDVGMTGSYQSIIGMKVEGALYRLVQKLPQRFEVVERGGSIFATLIQVETDTGKAVTIQRLHVPPQTLLET